MGVYELDLLTFMTSRDCATCVFKNVVSITSELIGVVPLLVTLTCEGLPFGTLLAYRKDM